MEASKAVEAEKLRIVVIGAGVTGLTTALLLSKNPAYSISIVAKHMPGDYDIEYTSPWAGANYLPVSLPDTEEAEWDRNTWPELEKLARDRPEAGVHFQEAIIYNRGVEDKSANSMAKWDTTEPWYKDVVPNFRMLPGSTYPYAYASAYAFTSVCINPPIYLAHLLSRCVAAGVHFHRATLPHLLSATAHHRTSLPPHLLLNCTGISSHTLGGVADPALVPHRGHTVLVRNSARGLMPATRGNDDAADEVVGATPADAELCYVMERGVGGGTVLGGTYQAGRWDAAPDVETAERIMRRAVKVCPELVGEGGTWRDLDVVRHGVGLRPVRVGGARVERERMRGEDGREWEVVHSYGHGGWGYQCSYGCAMKVVGLVEEALGR